MGSGFDVQALAWPAACTCPGRELCTCGARDGSPVALRDEITRYFIAHRGTVYRYLRSCGYARTDAEDATQDAFLALYRARLDGQQIREPLAWLLIAGKRRASNRTRHAYVERRVFESLSHHMADTLPDEGQDCEEDMIARQQRAAFLHALQDLSPLQRNCVHFRAEGLTLGQIAEMLGITAKRASQAYQRGIRRLRRIIDAR
jgi:RNA polymerase sigma factor (sigma-70 family)